MTKKEESAWVKLLNIEPTPQLGICIGITFGLVLLTIRILIP